jgi:glyoxylase-like metal-dependent hydrolase (beta-lactamase superfamily II)
VHHVQREHWLRARSPSDREASSFSPEVLDLLQHSNALHLLDGESSPLPDVELVVSAGHTTGQQLTRFRGDGTHVVFCGDLVPTHAHLRPTWLTAYDLHPLTAVEEKRVLLAEALEEGGVLALAHDPGMAACRLREEDGAPVFQEAVEL